MAKITTIVDGFDVQRVYISELRFDADVSNQYYFTNEAPIDVMNQEGDKYMVHGMGYKTVKDELGNLTQENTNVSGWVNKSFIIE